jgi:hypothetical protein
MLKILILNLKNLKNWPNGTLIWVLHWSTTSVSHRVHRIMVLYSVPIACLFLQPHINLFTSFSMVKRWFILILSQCHIINAAASLGFLFSSPCHLACPQSTRSRRCNSTSTINRQSTPIFFTSSYLVPG